MISQFLNRFRMASLSSMVVSDNMPTFSYHVTRGVLVIIDEGSGPPITLKAKEVLQRIYADDSLLAELDIIYRDRRGRYDSLVLIDGCMVGYQILQVMDEDDAIDALAKLNEEGA